MRILIINDDGIVAPGLAVAEKIAAEIGGSDAEIWVVAPELERSGVSHAISYVAPMRLTELAPRRWAVEGFPADCALVGLHTLLRDAPPDLILSGVNRGHNVAEDVVYSGTVGGAMEGALNGVKSIALSQFYRLGAADAPEDPWEPALKLGAEAVRRVLTMPWPEGVFYNINFPAVRPEAARGMIACAHGLRKGASFEVVPHTAPNGREFQFLRHRIANDTAGEGTDARLLIEGWVTVTPLRVQLTAEDLLADVQACLG